MVEKLIHRVLALLTILFVRLTRLLPLPVSRCLGRLCGRLAYYLIPRVRKVGMANLDLAYGDSLSREEKRRILKGAAENVGIVAAEFSRMPLVRTRPELGFVKLRNVAFFDRSRGGMFLSAHIGNWEWIAAALSAHGMPMAEIVRPLEDPLLNAFVDTTRRSGGFDTVPKDHAGAELLRLMRQGVFVGVLADQSPSASAVPVTFFGQPCWATIAPVLAFLRAQLPVYPVCMAREPDGHYVLEIWDAIEMERTGDFYHDILVNAQRVQDEIERMVRAHPEQWLWLHRRWKPRPRLAAEWEARTKRAHSASP